MARLMCASGLGLAGYEPDSTARVTLSEASAIQTCHSLVELVSSVSKPRKIWVMPGAAAYLEHLEPLLAADDIVVDCTVLHYQNTVRRSKELADRRIKLIDAGVSGSGTHFALMLGGDAKAIETLKPWLEAVSPHRWVHCGPSGSGHFVKQVHNHIEASISQTLNQSLAAVINSGSFTAGLPAMAQIWQISGTDRAAIQGLVVDFLNESDVLSRIRSSNPKELESLHQQMTPALNLALALHYADQGTRLFQQQIAAVLGAATRNEPG